MNLPNKLTMLRIILTVIIIVVLLLPYDALGIDLPKLFINEKIVLGDIKYPIAGILFILASVTDFFDGKIARKYNMITDLGKMLDAIADKMLVNSVLIVLSAMGFIHALIPTIIIVRDIAVDAFKMAAGNKGKVVAAIRTGKIKTACLMTGIALTLFYNLPFELWNLKVADFLLIVATVLSVISGIQYYNMNKKYIMETATK
jgi:CDP-diacylglycerol--glycerol-3-phosphate 3-phosphatidyltransferase